MPIAVLTFDFDPVVKLGDSASVRLETLAVAAVLFAGLVVTTVLGRRRATGSGPDSELALRSDDLIFMVIGAVPGALLGGRLGYVLDHLQYYRDNTAAITDFTQGALNLTLAVPLALLTGGLIGRLIGAPVGRWLQVAAAPLLGVLAAVKAVAILGATGQGLASELPWATAYAGPGPWGSLAAAVPSQPAQLYEAILLAVAVAGLLIASRFDLVGRGNGGALFAALGLWAIVRFVVAFTWRDPVVAGPLRTDQLLALLLVALAILGLAERRRAPILSDGWAVGELDPEPAE